MSNDEIPKQKTLSLDELFELENMDVNDPMGDTAATTPDASPNKRYSKEELKEAKKDNKYYLPVLSLNDAGAWQSKPISQRRRLTDKVAVETCLSNCCGVPGVYSACCRLDPDDLEHVLGPVTEKWIKKFLRTSRKKGWNYKRSDIVIDYEEGKLLGAKFFDNHPIFDKPSSYPFMRIQATGNRFACKFLRPSDGMCGIYEHRPGMCRNYLCQYIKKSFLITTKAHPNTYKRVDVGLKTDD